MTRADCRNWLASILILAAPSAGADGISPENWDITGEIELEATGYFEEPQFTGQDRDSGSVAGRATFEADWLDGDLQIRITPFLRYDSADDRRTHGDLREAKVDYTSGNWSLTFGADTVFWGTTEVVHLVDIINQTDLVENLDDEDRLGQPMIRVAYLSDIGEFSAFALPYFRERTFPGVSGRLRFNPPVNTAQPIFETEAEEFTPSFAVRYSGVIGDVDLGISAFHGLSRDPSFFFDGQSLRPVYSRINQFGVDAQYTTDATLWKFEGIFRDGQRDATGRRNNFVAVTGGLEHTLFGVFGTNMDLGLIGEFAYDDRGEDALTTFQNDAIFGTRLAFNDPQDTAFLLTSSIDVAAGAVALRLEGETRLTDSLKLEIESQGFVNQDKSSFAGSFADDSFFRARLRWFF